MAHWTQDIPYFSTRELRCKGSGAVRLDLRFAAALPALRKAWGLPLIPTSVCRTPDHNRAVGGHPRSMHLTNNDGHPDADGTMAADIAWRGWDPQTQLEFARLAYQHGWAVGLHDGFIHVDRRADLGLPKQVFLYGSSWSAPFNREDVL